MLRFITLSIHFILWRPHHELSWRHQEHHDSSGVISDLPRQSGRRHTTAGGGIGHDGGVGLRCKHRRPGQFFQAIKQIVDRRSENLNLQSMRFLDTQTERDPLLLEEFRFLARDDLVEECEF